MGKSDFMWQLIGRMKKLQLALILVTCLLAISLVAHALRLVESDSVPWRATSTSECGQFEMGGYDRGELWKEKYSLLAHPSIPYTTTGYGRFWNSDEFDHLQIRAGALSPVKVKLGRYTFIVIHPEESVADVTGDLVEVYDFAGTSEEFIETTTPLKNNGDTSFQEMLDWILEVNQGKLTKREKP